MLPVWLLTSLSFEGGVWSTLLFRRRRDPRRIKDVLIRGRMASTTHLPIVDEQLRRQAGDATKLQAFAARNAVKMIRGFMNFKAFEHLVLMAVKARWPKRSKAISSEVKLCL
jgi:hypothetical protein